LGGAQPHGLTSDGKVGTADVAETSVATITMVITVPPPTRFS